MSDYKFDCPSCRQRISATDEYIGHQISCPHCHNSITVPPPSGAGVSSIATPLPPGMPPPPAPPAASRLSVAALNKGGHSEPEPAPSHGQESSIATPLPPGMPPPPTPPSKGKLAVSALSPQKEAAPAAQAAPAGHSPNPLEQMGTAKYQQFKARKAQKNYTGIIVGSCCAVAVVVCGFIFKDSIVAKYHSMRGTPEVVVDTNTPPPPPPELTVDEVWQKVAATYKTLAGYSATGKAVSSLDYSQINSRLSANGPRIVMDDLTLKMNRPNDFRIDLVEQTGTSNRVFVGWSAGQGDYIQIDTNRSHMGSAFPVFASVNRIGSALGASVITELYFNTSDSVPFGGTWTRDDDQTINGHASYVLTGTLFMHDAQVFVDRGTFLVDQIAFQLDGRTFDDNSLDDAKLKSALMASGLATVTPGDLVQFKRTLKAQSKLKGAVIETFTDTQPNANLAMSDFQPPDVITAPAVPMTQNGGNGGNQGPGRGLGGSGPGGVAGRLRQRINAQPQQPDGG